MTEIGLIKNINEYEKSKRKINKTGSTGVTLKEATYINRSLTFLEQVVVALTERKGRANDHVPWLRLIDHTKCTSLSSKVG